MKERFLFAFALIASLVPHSASAYELATHGAITQKAYQRSSLVNDGQLLKDLGIKDGPNAFGESYYDVSGAEVRERKHYAFENKIIKGTLGVEELSLPGWLLRGAIREDDHPLGPNPQFDDPVNAIRPFNHFYDPVWNRALTTVLGSLGKKAPDWGAGTSDIFSQPNREDAFRMNHFTVFDAREAMYRALTGKNQNGDDVVPTKDDRNKYWATLFRALGDIVHLVEDMAQPQHTRNDPHAGKYFDQPSRLGHKSVYEAYVEARATGGTLEVPGVFNIAAHGLSYDGYPVPRFTDYLSYFTTRHQHPDPNQILVRQGLADYSNRGFFTAGTNIESENNAYALPDRNPAAYLPTNLYVDWQGEPLGSNPDAMATILQGSVPDSLPGGQTATNIPLTTHGAWDQFLRPKGKTDYSLNRYNYDAMADLLIPRAVAYSAGFMNYFFRGRVEAEGSPDTDTYTDTATRSLA